MDIASVTSSELLSRQAARESNARTYPRGLPLAIGQARGCEVWSVEGKRYHRWLRSADLLREMNLGAVDLSDLAGVTADSVAHYAELVRRYDVAHLRWFAQPKSRAIVACFLIEREKTLLDEHRHDAPRVSRGPRASST